jgi:uncharacterized protein YodC (DUF2158 family)
MSEFQEGNVVRVKSDSPNMTITELGNYYPDGPKNGAVCVWFEGKTQKREVFDVAVLELVIAKNLTDRAFRIFPRSS